MTYTDYVGFVGVAILLVAFFLNSFGNLKQDGFWYITLNLIGAGIACYASALMHYVPFIILESLWSLVSLVALINLLRKRRMAIINRDPIR